LTCASDGVRGRVFMRQGVRGTLGVGLEGFWGSGEPLPIDLRVRRGEHRQGVCEGVCCSKDAC
jgi:hypothetical protein